MPKAFAVSCTLLLLAVTFSAFAADVPQPNQSLTPAQPALQETMGPLPQAAPPQPVFLSTVLECQNSCYDDFRSCQTQNPFSICWKIYQLCRCGCNDSCNP
jgi:hypothetical protein